MWQSRQREISKLQIPGGGSGFESHPHRHLESITYKGSGFLGVISQFRSRDINAPVTIKSKVYPSMGSSYSW
jgi:hypothetical protein